MSTMNVVKFGGTSVGSAERMREVAAIIATKEGKTVVVLSAMSGVTNSLEELLQSKKSKDEHAYSRQINALIVKHRRTAQELLGSADGCLEEIDKLSTPFQNLHTVTDKQVMALGEQLSTLIFHHYMQSLERNTSLFDALKFMVLDEQGEPDEARIAALLQNLLEADQADFIITQGFICRDAQGAVSNLKRGGSDYSAALIAAAVNADCFEIWTDIDGFHNNDPRYVTNTRSISSLTFAEAAELAYFGAKILHPATVWPARRKGISVHLKNTMKPNMPGTVIGTAGESTGFKAIAAKDGITAVSIRSARMLMAYGFLSKVFGIFEKYRTPIDMITTSEVAVSMSVDNPEQLPSIVGELSQWGEIEVDTDQTIISIVGHRIGHEKGLAAPVFHALREIPLRMISFGGSAHNISVLIPKAHKIQALQALHNELFN